MRIVDYETFIRMPAGTIFAPFEPCVFRDRLQIKVDAGCEGFDYKGNKRWFFNGTMPLEPWNVDILYDGCDSEEATFEVYDGDSTDASAYKLFCVLEPNDVKKLINALYWSLAGCPGDFEEYENDLIKKVAEYEDLWHQLTDRVNAASPEDIEAAISRLKTEE